MDFGFWDIIFIVALTIFFLSRELSKSRVLAEAGQVKYRNMVKEVIFCKSEIVDGQIFVYEKNTNAFITQQPDVESMFKYFIKNHPDRRIQFGE